MTVKKRVLSLLSVLVLLATVLPFETSSAKATDSTIPTITVDTVDALPGASVMINVSIEHNPGILGATLTLSFGEGLTLTEVTAGSNSAFDALTLTKPGKFVSPCNFVWDVPELKESDIKDGSFLSLTFQVSEDVTSGKRIPIELSYDICGQDLEQMQVNVINGGVVIEGGVLGDVNEDGTFSLSDVILVARYLVKLETLSEEQLTAADVNQDGHVTNADVVKMARVLASLESFE